MMSTLEISLNPLQMMALACPLVEYSLNYADLERSFCYKGQLDYLEAMKLPVKEI
uniref:Uncharacterized protein n=1 Tax=Rhizophora mucronata TaxID=61149 RepID=A0A2P2P5G3_RHIMU